MSPSMPPSGDACRLEPYVARVRDRLTVWWEGEDQEHPCLLATLPRPEVRLPDTEDLDRFWTDVDFIHRRAMARLSGCDYFGLAVPCHYIDQGSSAMAGVLGCPMEYIDKETVWAHPAVATVESVPEVAFTSDSPVYARILAILRRSVAAAPGHHMVAPFALEGMTDLMAALYGLEPFLMDLILKPAEVARAMEHLKVLWLRAWEEVQGCLAASGNPGGIGWVGIWAPGSTFPLQEDVAYNLSPEMFRTFCLPHIADQMAVMDYPFFHLDGIGMIPHLELLLGLADLKVVQWQPGAGKERIDRWYDLIRRILRAGKSVQVYASSREVPDLVAAVGARGLLVILTDTEREPILRLLDRYPQED